MLFEQQKSLHLFKKQFWSSKFWSFYFLSPASNELFIMTGNLFLFILLRIQLIREDVKFDPDSWARLQFVEDLISMLLRNYSPPQNIYSAWKEIGVKMVSFWLTVLDFKFERQMISFTMGFSILYHGFQVLLSINEYKYVVKSRPRTGVV